MLRVEKMLLVCVICALAVVAHAQTAVKTTGALVIVPAYGEVRQANDEARITLAIEEQDKDKAVAASRVNQKMKQGVEILKREDPQATLRTRGYYTYPLYADEAARQANKTRQLTGWRVGQYMDVTTTNLGGLPKTVAAVQRLLTLNGIQFGLSEAATKKLDVQRIEASYRHLTERIAAIAKAMGRELSDAVLETVDFEASGAYAQQQDMASPKMMRAAAMVETAAVEEPSFEPGETALHMRVVGKVKFK